MDGPKTIQDSPPNTTHAYRRTRRHPNGAMVPMAVHLQSSLGQVIFTEASLWSTFATRLAALWLSFPTAVQKFHKAVRG